MIIEFIGTWIGQGLEGLGPRLDSVDKYVTRLLYLNKELHSYQISVRQWTLLGRRPRKMSNVYTGK